MNFDIIRNWKIVMALVWTYEVLEEKGDFKLRINFEHVRSDDSELPQSGYIIADPRRGDFNFCSRRVDIMECHYYDGGDIMEEIKFYQSMPTYLSLIWEDIQKAHGILKRDGEHSFREYCRTLANKWNLQYSNK